MIFDYIVKANNRNFSLANFRDKKVILIVNVASEWGLTKSNYTELQKLYERYNDKSFTILGFPCNQFGSQEPKPNKDIQNFIKRYNVRFPVFDKINVNGDKEHPLYTYLKTNVKEKSPVINLLSNSIKWNFTKFLCVNGIPIKKYEPTTSFTQIEKDIKKYI